MCLFVMLPTASLHAQVQRADAAAPASAILARVQKMVNAGDRDGAHAYADSIVQTAREGSEAYVEGLYARAFASSSAVEAERDYLRVSVEYSLSPRAEDATMMVAQLKLARGDRTGARRNFERLVREHPAGTQTAKAAFWAGRLALEDGDAVHGCQSLGVAHDRVSSDDVELANQVDYYRQRCSAGALAAATDSSSAAKGGKDAKDAKDASRPKTAREREKERLEQQRAEKARKAQEKLDAAKAEKERLAQERAEKARLARERADAARAEKARAEQERAAEPPPAAEVPPKADSVPARPVAPGKEFTVQVAAFPKGRDAEALKDVLQQRGYTARVWGTVAPFRVRVGRYATREEADAALARMKQSRLNGIVVEAEPQ